MLTSEFKNLYWKYYLILEKDLMVIEDYIAFHPDNGNCFSNEFIKLYQAICSEIDILCKEYCKFIDPDYSKVKKVNIMYYAKCILTHHPEITEQQTNLISNSDFNLIPWDEWSCDIVDYVNGDNPKNASPKWWQEYNKVKHNRLGKDSSGKYNYKNASLSNVINAQAALYILEKYFYADLTKGEALPGKTPDVVIDPVSKLFDFLDIEDEALIFYNI